MSNNKSDMHDPAPFPTAIRSRPHRPALSTTWGPGEQNPLQVAGGWIQTRGGVCARWVGVGSGGGVGACGACQCAGPLRRAWGGPTLRPQGGMWGRVADSPQKPPTAPPSGLRGTTAVPMRSALHERPGGSPLAWPGPGLWRFWGRHKPGVIRRAPQACRALPCPGGAQVAEPRWSAVSSLPRTQEP